MSRGRWSDNVYVLQNSIVGVICETARREWEAAGCMSDWMDTPLGTLPTRREAKAAVEQWVREESE